MATGEALVCKLKNITEIPGADNIVQANLFGETVIISKDYKEGQLGLLFDCESFLYPDYAKENNLYHHNNLNKDPNKIGYLEDSGRIRAIKLRGVKCSALFMPLESLSYLGKKLPQEGVQIKEWNGKSICDKYVRPIKQSNQQKQIKKTQQVFYFSEVGDTQQLLRSLNRIQVGNRINITTKLHGCSLRVGKLPCSPRGRFKSWLYKKLNIQYPYKMVVGSRHVLKFCEDMQVDNKTSFYEEDIWTKVAKENFEGKLRNGEQFFAEIVGFLPNGTSIMPSHSNTKLKNFLEKDEYKTFISKYGDNTIFHYGCNDKECKVFIYGGSLVTDNGTQIFYSVEQLKRRCEEMNLNYVPEIISSFYITEDNLAQYQDEQFWINLTEQDCNFFPNHLNEGIVARIDGPNLKPEVYKSKNYKFKCMEGIIKDKEQNADIEEAN